MTITMKPYDYAATLASVRDLSFRHNVPPVIPEILKPEPRPLLFCEKIGWGSNPEFEATLVKRVLGEFYQKV